VSQDQHIALMVDEPIPGHFYWMLLRQQDAQHHPQVVECAPGPLPGYAAAMRAGIDALQRRADARANDEREAAAGACAVAPGAGWRERPRHH